MTAVLGGAVLLCLGSCLVGAALLRLLQAPHTATAPAVGFAALVIVADGVLNLGGDGVEAAIAVAVVICAAVAAELWVRPLPAPGPLAGALVAGGLALAAGSLPFLANGRVGTMGVSILNDLAIHEYWAWARDSGHVYAGLIYPGYPLGAHSLVGALSELTGTNVEHGFAAVLIGAPALTALTAYGAFAHLGRGVRSVAAALAAFPYLGAAFLGEGSFKEPMVVVLVLGFAVTLQQVGQARTVARRQLIALGVLTAACCLIEGGPGLAWPGLTLLLWGLSELLRRRRKAVDLLRSVPGPAALGLLVLLVAVSPALSGLLRFSPNLQGSNLPFRLPFAETMAIWFETDFRLVNSQLFSATVLAVLGVALFAYATWWWQRRRGDALPAAALAGLLTYLYVHSRSGGYLTAKAETVWAGLYMVVVVGALFDLVPRVSLRGLVHRPSGWPAQLARRAPQIVLVVAFAVAAARSSALTLRYALVDSDARDQALSPVRPIVHGQPTMMLVADDFAPWELRGARQASLTSYGIPDQVPFVLSPDRPPPTAGVATDFASVTSSSLDHFRYAVTTTSAFAASPPPNWHLVLRNQAYALWRRTGPTPQMQAPPGSTAPVSRLDCSLPAVRRLLPTSTANERPAPVVGPTTNWHDTAGDFLAANPTIVAPASGHTIAQNLVLGAGVWDISVQYQSGVPLSVTAGSHRSVLPADLDVFGSYWTVAVVHSTGGTVPVTIHLAARPFPGIQMAYPIGPLVATRIGVRSTRVPAAQACGHFVDWLVATPRA
jgi:hypothetical protein